MIFFLNSTKMKLFIQNSSKTPCNPSKRYLLCQKDATFACDELNSFNFDQIYKKVQITLYE